MFFRMGGGVFIGILGGIGHHMFRRQKEWDKKMFQCQEELDKRVQKLEDNTTTDSSIPYEESEGCPFELPKKTENN